MTAQHAPHTPPLWRRFFSLPHTRLGWWAVGLVGIYWVLTATVDFTDRLSVLGTEVASGGSGMYWLVFSAWSLAGVAGTVVALIALLRHERSALVWLAMVAGLPAFVGANWLALVLLGTGVTLPFGISTLPELAALFVLTTVLICVLIAGLQRYKSEKQR